jgi:hypothetical protein
MTGSYLARMSGLRAAAAGILNFSAGEQKGNLDVAGV